MDEKLLGSATRYVEQEQKMRVIRFLILASAIVAASGEHALAQATGRWASHCVAGEDEDHNRTDEKHCLVTMYPAVQTQDGPQLFSISVHALKSEGVAIFLLGSTSGHALCTNAESTIRVDRNEALTLQILPPGSGVLVKGPAADMLAQLIAGTKLWIRLYVGAHCEQKDLEVSLAGFTAAWRKAESGESWEPDTKSTPK